MIDKQEVIEFAREFSLDPHVIEKDYVLGWILAGIASHHVLKPTWIFKGGTCLKKCYFETYRFSEDLDFTLTDPEHLNAEYLGEQFLTVADWVYDQTGIEIPQDTLRFKVYKNSQGGESVEGRIGYRGPLLRRGDAPRIKLDLTASEILVLEPSARDVHHPYSDRPAEGINISCYSFEEVFAEKIRALAERERPRDLYDVVHLYRHDELTPDREVVFNTLEKKCSYKGIPVPAFAALETQPARAELEAEWENMLGHQLPALPPFEQFWNELPAVFSWLYGASERVAKPAMAMGEDIDESWRPPSMAQAWHINAPLEIVRFAAANRLCIALFYQGNTRLIEPYSLRRTKAGNLLLYAVKHRTGEIRAYRVDRIQGAEVSHEAFTPKYAVELTPVGSMSAPPVQNRPTLGLPYRSRSSRMRRSSSSGPKYVIECPYCGKRFTRKKRSTKLNKHNDQYGNKCSGSFRTGSLVDTIN